MSTDKTVSRKRPGLPALVRQQDKYGCVLACLAMVLGRRYEELHAEFGGAGVGRTYHDWQAYLSHRGYAVQHIWKHDGVRRRDRAVWPLQPWTDVHLCAVDAGHGAGTHLVVLLRDGTVLDPMRDEPARWSDYTGVAHMTGIIPAPDAAPEGALQ